MPESHLKPRSYSRNRYSPKGARVVQEGIRRLTLQEMPNRRCAFQRRSISTRRCRQSAWTRTGSNHWPRQNRPETNPLNSTVFPDSSFKRSGLAIERLCSACRVSDRMRRSFERRQAEAKAQIAVFNPVKHHRKIAALKRWVFPGKTEEGHRSTIAKQFQAARAGAGFDKSVVLYCSRHTFGTSLLQETGNLALVKDTMGHESIVTTQKYLHPSTTGVADIINQRNRRHGPQLVKSA